MGKKIIDENAGEKLVSVFIPKQNRNDTQKFVCVNGERILVQTGTKVEIPAKFAQVLKNSEEMLTQAKKYIEENCED